MKKKYCSSHRWFLTAFILLKALLLSLQSEITIHFQEGTQIQVDELEIDIGSYTGTEDSILLSGANAARNYGASNSLYLGKTIASGNPVESRALLRFDLSSLHEVADLIESATLTLTFVSGTNAANVGVNLYQIQSANAEWAEGTANGSAQAGSISWGHRVYHTTPWAGGPGLSTAGIDYVASVIDGTKTVATNGAGGTQYTWTLPAPLVESWSNGDNAGLLLAVSDFGALNQGDYFRFASSEHATASWRPSLTVTLPDPSLISHEYVLSSAETLEPFQKVELEIPDNIRKYSGQKYYLWLTPRLNTGGSTTGSAYGLKVSIDGLPVTIDHLANKQDSYAGSDGKTQWAWFSEEGVFRVLYNPYHQINPTYGMVHAFAFDVDSIIDGGNAQKITIENVFDGVPNTVLDVTDIRLAASPPIVKSVYPVNAAPHYLSHGLKWARQLATARHQGIGLSLDTSDGTSLPVNLQFPVSYPVVQSDVEVVSLSDTNIQLNQWQDIPLKIMIGTPGDGWAQDWTVINANTWQRSQYRISRNVEADAHGVIISDTVTNLSSGDLPLAILYQFDAGDLSDLREFRLQGRAQPNFYANTIPGRPSASYPVGYVRDEERAYAVVVEDDALRTQGSWLTWDSCLNVGTDMFYLQQGQSHTFRIRIIAAPSGNYYEILNRLRQAWDNYQTIPGLFGFVYPKGIDEQVNTPAKVQAFFNNTGITVPAFASSNLAPDGTRRMAYGSDPLNMVQDAYQNSTAPFVAMMQAQKIDLPILHYMDVHLVRSDGDQDIINSISSALVKDINNNRVDYLSGWLHIALPLLDNVAGEGVERNLNYYLEDTDITGMFLDEWDHSRSRIDFSRQDGMTARLNENLSISQKVGIIPLMTRNFQNAVINKIQGHDGVMFANQMDQTAFAQQLPIVHFAEPTQHDHYLLYSAQVSRTPLGLNTKRSTSVWNDTYEFLRKGVLLCFYSKRLYGNHLLKYVYPIKVISTDVGVVVGEDRIVTLRSGHYVFTDGEPVEALVFGAPGGAFRRTVQGTQGGDGKYTVDLALSETEREIALIRKID